MPPELPCRKNLRLPEYDYRQVGSYFVTICVINKENLLCQISPPPSPADDPEVCLTDIGHCVEEMILKIPGIDKYVIMPNHIHMIIFQRDEKRELAKTVQFFKSNITRKIKRAIWQRNYYEHVIRDEQDYLIKWKYIDDNPAKWAAGDREI